MNKLKTYIFEKIRDDNDGSLISKIFDSLLVALIIVNIVTVIADTFNVPAPVGEFFYLIEVVSVVIFSIEYILRVWTSDLIRPKLAPWKARLRYVFSFMALIDLIAILPFYIPFLIPVDLRVLRALRIIRLLRIFKISRYTTALSTIGAVFVLKRAQLMSSVFVVALLMIISSVIMYNVENSAQPDTFSNAFSAMWWAVATLTTVGYGDIYPITVAGKIISAIIALLGIGLVAVPTGIISAGFIEQMDENKQHDEKCFCPYCGHNLEN
ncbi:MAG: ion transporter [Lactobacillales bacterium]|jgi:voltage-gated potassium channel|nr:ion transporter [Lactobacillales bacterium]